MQTASSPVNDLLGPEELGSGPVELIETHLSWVFLTETEVFKVKRPVDLGFVDFRTLDARKQACDAELLLNRRLAPDVYRDVVPLRLVWGRYSFRGDGEIVEWAVHMKRLPKGECAETRMENGALTGEDIDRLAAHVATFHANCRCDEETSRYGGIDTIRKNVEENFSQTESGLIRYLSSQQVSDLAAWQRSFLAERGPLFSARQRQRRVRDGHGDLRLEHVYVHERGFSIIDCIEFSDRFRFADICADLAFLSMDLAWHGRVDLAERLIARYARESSDFDLYALVDFYESYRAFVRGKIANFIVDAPDTTDVTRARMSDQARKYFLLALSASRKGLLSPVLVGVGGLIAAGKSTVAEHLGDRMSAPVVDADRTRKHLLGAGPLENVSQGTWVGPYDPMFTEKVYEEVLRRAEVVLASGRAVIVDASFRARKLRIKLRALAERLGVPFVFVECTAPDDVCRARLREREIRASVSDGRVTLFDDFRRHYEPVTEFSTDEHIVIDTTAPLATTDARLERLIPVWPTNFVT